MSDPAGHSFGHVEPPVTTAEAADWRRSPTFLHGIDLFNAGCYWEAHEAWEQCWIAAGRTGALADALKGLIKLAAAGVKHLAGNAAGVARHLARARHLFEAAGPEVDRLGLDAAILAAGCSALPDAIPFRPPTAGAAPAPPPGEGCS